MYPSSVFRKVDPDPYYCSIRGATYSDILLHIPISNPCGVAIFMPQASHLVKCNAPSHSWTKLDSKSI